MGGHSSEGWWEQSGRAGVQVMSYPRTVNVQAVQMHWGMEKARRAVPIWRTQGGTEEKGRNVLVCN